ncbi:hypothetical protein [Spongiimicrobium sp. 3-5]|uniref:hypothetical protein n=1 Tax=Spongiimicrobium sp. 3-5 TaxID=3332596 RepID=UPI00397EE58A
MKKVLLLILLCTGFISHSQISFGPKHYGKPGKLDKEILENFKKTTTIFVFSNVYEKDIYENILKDSWDVTSYKIVAQQDFNPFDYQENYSFAQVGGFKSIKTTKMGSIVTRLYTYFDIFLYDFESINKKAAKLNPKKLKKKIDDIFTENKVRIARFNLFADSDFVNTVVRKSMDEISSSLFNDDIFHNYTPGMLKNYFQKLNQLISDGEVYWMYEENDYTKEILELQSNLLYIPNYFKIKTNAFTAGESESGDDYVKSLYDTYVYDYKFIDMDNLDDKILKEEKIYYLRYVRLNAEKFIEIVNSRTGEVIYRNYITGLSYNIKPKHLKELNKTISKAIKKNG